MLRAQRDDQIDRFDRRLKELRVEYEKFFNGALDIPPADDHDRLGKEIRRFRDTARLKSVDRYRLVQLEARYNSYSELFHRRIRHQEAVGRRSAAGDTQSKTQLDLEHGVVVGDRLAPKLVEALYKGLAQGGGNPRFDLETFRSYLSHQAGEIRRKTGCEKVRFRIVDSGGQPKLRAKPIREEAAAPGG